MSENEFSSYNEIYYLNEGEEDEMEIYGYESSPTRTTVTWICIILSFGILRLIFHWYNHWMLYCTHQKCSLKFAETVLILDKYQGCHTTYYVKTVTRINLEKLSPEDVAVVCNDLNIKNVTRAANDAGSVVRIYFSDGSFVDENYLVRIKVKELTYVWYDKKNQFCKLAGIEKSVTKTDLHNLPGYSKYQQLIKRIIYSKNEIDVKNQKQLANTVRTEGNITVCRSIGKSKHDAIYEDISISDLVPGDIIVIPRTGFIVPCDAVLLFGHCIVNESMLTGESVPVTKTALPYLNTPYNEVEDVSHTLYCGTHVMQARYYADEIIHAVVLRTGFLTAKGNLVRSILFPLPHDFKFDQDTYKFVWILAIVAMSNGDPLFENIIDSLDIITIVVPPALPAALSVGKYYAQNRLQKQKISCINASVINVSGSVNCVCFDKTGTLTEDGLDLYGVIPVNNGLLGEVITNIQTNFFTNLKEAMASCHSLTLINGVISGDPLDVKMFEATGWILDETEIMDAIKYDLLPPTVVKSPADDQEIGIIHQFQFSSRLQRMSVITRHLISKQFTIYCKGSPEMIISLCTPESGLYYKQNECYLFSVPTDLETELEKQTEEGYRVIAIAYRTFPAIDIIKLRKLHRDDVECNLTLAGLIIFENKLKPQTSYIISDLRQAKMKIVMLTGDNLQTAICVAKECGIIAGSESIINVSVSKNNGINKSQLMYTPCKNKSPKYVQQNTKIFSISNIELGLGIGSVNRKYVLTGHMWSAIRELFPHKVNHILQHAAIFARMSADQKQQVIQELQAMEFYVAMCGDGANDCGALKTADVGISLSEAESSVASPFTSHQSDITCVPKIIKEGRTALVTSVGLFKFMILYSLVEFFSSVWLFTHRSALSDFEFLFIDVFLIVVFAFFFGQTKPYRGPLVPTPPSSSLLSTIPLMSIFFQFFLMGGMQILSELIVKQFKWYRGENELFLNYNTYDNYAIYTISQFQYIILAITFSVGQPYREPIYRNTYFFLSLVIMTAVSVFITVYPPMFLVELFSFKLPPTLYFRYVVISLSIITFVISVVLESFVVNYVLTKILIQKNTKVHDINYHIKKPSKDLTKSSFEHLSEIEVKCYGTMKS
ncbi:hypothetical protein PGB90_006658 [Kerria lacca]